MRAELDKSADIMVAEFGTPATYLPIAGGSVELSAIMSFATAVIVDGNPMAAEVRDIADIRRVDVAQPQSGDRLSVDDNLYRVDTYDRTGSLWRLTLLQI